MLVDLIDSAANWMAARFNPSRAIADGEAVTPSRGAGSGFTETRRDYLNTYPARNNSAFDAVGNFLARGLSELRPALRPADGPLVFEQPMLELWRHPNPHHTNFHMLSAVIKNAFDTGHAFIIIETDARAFASGLYYAPSQAMQMLVDEMNSWPVGWRYFMGGRAGVGPSRDIVAERVIHIQWEIDPLNTRASRGAGQVLASDVATDGLARDWTARQLNKGIAGTGIAMPYDLDDADAAERAEVIQQKLSAANQGDTVVMPGGTTFTHIGATARELQLRELSRLPEERICAEAGIPAMTVGLGAGLDRSTFTNYAASERVAYKYGVIPAGRMIAEAVTRALLWRAEFDPARRYEFVLDGSELSVLQEDADAVYAREIAAFTAGLTTAAEAREAIGLDAELPESEDEADTLSRITYPALAAVQGGVITPNEMREALGLPNVEGGDDLLVPGLPRALTGGNGVIDAPFREYQTAGERLAAALARLRDAQAAELTAPMRNLLIAAAERAVAQAASAVAASGVIPEGAALYASFADDVAVRTLPQAVATAEGVAAAINASGLLPNPVTVTDSMSLLVRNNATSRALEIQGTRVGQWNAVVRDRQALGWTPDQILNGGGPLPDELKGLKRPGLREVLGEQDYNGQAEAIVRTESAFAQAESAATAYAEQGVREVLISDGVEDDICAAANGQVWSIEDYAANPLGHPNCTRSAEPIMPPGEAT